jgi:hypothetical protein
MQTEIDRCHDEIAEIEAQLRAGHRDLHGLLLALADWHAELRLLQGEPLVDPNSIRACARRVTVSAGRKP